MGHRRSHRGRSRPRRGGGRPVPPRVFEIGGVRFRYLSEPLADCSPADAELSPAEREVAALARAGLSNAEIARARGVAARTIANQLASIFRKLRVGSRVELAAALDPN